MKTVSILRLALDLSLALAMGAASAQERPSREHREAPPAAEHHETGGGGGGILRLLPPDSVTEHSIDTANGKLAYTATAGTLAVL